MGGTPTYLGKRVNDNYSWPVKAKEDEEKEAWYPDNTPDLYALGVVLAHFVFKVKGDWNEYVNVGHVEKLAISPFKIILTKLKDVAVKLLNEKRPHARGTIKELIFSLLKIYKRAYEV